MQNTVTGVHSTIKTKPTRNSVVENQMMTMITQFSAGTPIMNLTTGRENSSQVRDKPMASPMGIPMTNDTATASSNRAQVTSPCETKSQVDRIVQKLLAIAPIPGNR